MKNYSITRELDVTEAFEELSHDEQTEFVADALYDFDVRDTCNIVKDAFFSLEEYIEEELLEELFEAMGRSSQERVMEYMKDVLDDSAEK